MKTTKKLNDGRIKLTKDNINDGYIREFIKKIEGNDKVLSDEELIEEIVGLIEWPVVFLGQIDKEFLTLPKEILRVTMKEHQKFLSVLNHFPLNKTLFSLDLHLDRLQLHCLCLHSK